MTGDHGGEQDLEFGRYAGWRAEAIADLPGDQAIAAACQGSGNPSALRWLADRLDVGDGVRFLDAGGGLGGPAAWLRLTHGADVVVAEPMVSAATAARRLWKVASVAAWAHHLPFPAETFHSAWTLGVLDTTIDKTSVLGELRRVLAPGATLGILSYERAPGRSAAADEMSPDGNDFPSANEMEVLLARVGWTVRDVVAVADLDAPPTMWGEACDLVDARVEQVHGADAAFAVVMEQQRQVAALLDGGLVVARLYALRSDGPEGGRPRLTRADAPVT